MKKQVAPERNGNKMIRVDLTPEEFHDMKMHALKKRMSLMAFATKAIRKELAR